MYYVIVLMVGIATGAACMFLYVMQWHQKIKERERASDARVRWAEEAAAAAAAREQEIESLAKQRNLEFHQSVQAKTTELNRLAAEAKAAEQARTSHLNRLIADANAREADLQRRIISYRELQEENALLKRDLQNIDVNLHKLQLDGEARHQQQAQLDARSSALAKRYLAETVKAVGAAIGANNFSACKNRLVDVIERVREIGYDVPTAEEARLLADLKAEFERAVRADFERQEQARIKAQIREEEKLKREVERELRQLERERLAVQAALDQATAQARGAFSEEVERLKARLAEAEEKSRRTLSMAEQTKAGHVYVISNIGTLGSGIFKVGMTRRLDPRDRIKELGDASVPFPFDVHMMIHCENAPSLENALHRALHKRRVNKANPRKEYFRAEIDEILELVRAHHGEVQYVADPEALEYRQSLTMSDEDAEFIEEVYDAADDDAGTTVED